MLLFCVFSGVLLLSSSRIRRTQAVAHRLVLGPVQLLAILRIQMQTQSYNHSRVHTIHKTVDDAKACEGCVKQDRRTAPKPQQENSSSSSSKGGEGG